MKRKSRYQGHFREKMVGANLYETDIEAVSELRTEQGVLSRLRRSSPVIEGKQQGYFLLVECRAI